MLTQPWQEKCLGERTGWNPQNPSRGKWSQKRASPAGMRAECQKRRDTKGRKMGRKKRKRVIEAKAEAAPSHRGGRTHPSGQKKKEGRESPVPAGHRVGTFRGGEGEIQLGKGGKGRCLKSGLRS